MDNEHDQLCSIIPDIAGTFKALGDTNRLHIIHLLSTDTSGTLGVGELAEQLGISQPAVSQALRILKSEEIVDSRKVGSYVYYTINRERIVQFRDHFDLMYANVMAKCDRELVRKKIHSRELNACVIFFSYSGVTRALARQIRNACGCDLIEIMPQKKYSTFYVYTTGLLHSRKGICDPIFPETIDVSQYDLLIFGTPVWIGNPTPPMNSAVRALRGCEGKKAVVFVTSYGQPGEALRHIREALISNGVEVLSEKNLTEKDIKSQNAGKELIWQIVEAYLASGSEKQDNTMQGLSG
ncbi:MAG TPA: metalloregulator ArsR/SmtB family transcription factor [Methanospirillum sp.]|nr:metalloregulator ArsR/SmtB family transcription factor [Methanospirillum sp.]